jgi:hypothetical protein
MRQGVWTRGTNTETDAWIAGESRTIVVTKEAIEAYLHLSVRSAAAMTAEQRRHFVEARLPMVISAATRKASATDHAGDSITIRRGEL